MLDLFRNPPSAPLIQDAETGPKIVEGKVQLRKDDWSKLPPESTYFLSWSLVFQVAHCTQSLLAVLLLPGVNRGKRSVGVNLKDAEGLKIVHELIAKADVLVSSQAP